MKKLLSLRSLAYNQHVSTMENVEKVQRPHSEYRMKHHTHTVDRMYIAYNISRNVRLNAWPCTHVVLQSLLTGTHTHLNSSISYGFCRAASMTRTSMRAFVHKHGYVFEAASLPISYVQMNGFKNADKYIMLYLMCERKTHYHLTTTALFSCALRKITRHFFNYSSITRKFMFKFFYRYKKKSKRKIKYKQLFVYA